MPTHEADFHFYTTAEYFDHLCDLISHATAKDRITIASMTLEPAQPPVRKVLDALRAASMRGAKVQLLVDAHTFLVGRNRWLGGFKPGPLFFNGKLPLTLRGQFRNIHSELESLQDAGGQYLITNEPSRRFSDPFAGRAHWKFAVINDEVFIGGCNLEGVDYADVMVGLHDAALASKLQQLVKAVASKGTIKDAMGIDDQRFPITRSEQLLLDVGVRGQSQIMVQALQLIDEANEFVVLGSQFFPNNVTGRRLLAAHRRGVKVHIIYNHPFRYSWPLNVMLFADVLNARRTLPRSFFSHAQKKRFLHAKILATENGSLVGSHNLVSVGVKLATVEMGILSTSGDFRHKLLRTISRQINEPIIGAG